MARYSPEPEFHGDILELRGLNHYLFNFAALNGFDNIVYYKFFGNQKQATRIPPTHCPCLRDFHRLIR